jgi:ATP-binding cassette subfamily B protein
MHMIVRLVAGMMLMVGLGMAFFSSYTLYRSGAFTIGTAYLVVYYTNLMSRPIRELTQQVESLQNIGASVERLSELRAFRSQITDGPGAVIPTGPLTLTFDGVSFAYIDGEPVLDGLNFELKPGSVLGLLGRTGSGKTTVTRLIFRLYDTTSGSPAQRNRVRQPPLRSAAAMSMVTQDAVVSSQCAII